MKTRGLMRAALLMAALLLSACAAAENDPFCPVNPHARTDREMVLTVPSEGEEDVRANGSLSVRFVSEAGTYFTEDTVWTFQASGGDGNYQYQFRLFNADESYQEGGATHYTDTLAVQHLSAANTFRYRVLLSGNYILQVIVRDGKGAGKSVTHRFSAIDETRLTNRQRAAQLAQECLAAGCAGDYEKALWLHDWLTHNARYDYSYTYYGADGVLMRGVGVGDSYSKAYQLMLEEAGIECVRESNASHAWNAAKLDGAWYQIDPAWDDPGESNGPIGGYESHLYFCVTSEQMQVDHDFTPVRVCAAYDDNYFVKTGTAAAWADALRARLTQGLEAGDYAFALPLPEEYVIEGFNYSATEKPYAAALADTLAFLYLGDGPFGTEAVPLTVEMDKTNRRALARVDFDGRTLTLPPDITDVESGAFQGDAACLAVTVSADAARIEAGAFAGCGGLWKAVIPGMNVQIEEGAFDSGNTHLTLVGPAGGAAQSYAQAHGLKFRTEE